MKFHTKRRLMENIKHLYTYFVTFVNHTKLSRFFLALEQANPRCYHP